MEKSLYFISIICIFLFQMCIPSSKSNKENELLLSFQNKESLKASDIIKEYKLITLETTENSIISQASQIEFHKNKIIILDNYKSNAVFFFSEDGCFINKIERKGEGPGEFLHPYSFKVDKEYIYVLDRTLSRLLKYDLTTFEFKEEIIMPSLSPISFHVISERDLYLYYYPYRENNNLENKQLIISDKSGKIYNKIYDSSESGKILHGGMNNFYTLENKTYFYPYFSNNIYSIENDSIYLQYKLLWDKYKFPDDSYFKTFAASNDLMQNLISGANEYIRMMYIYDTPDNLTTKYYMKKELYISSINKKSLMSFNINKDKIVDDMGFGGLFPLPVGTIENTYIGIIDPSQIDMNNISNDKLNKLLLDKSPDDNPVIVLYKMQ